MTTQKVLPKLATFATLCDASEKAIDVALSSNSRDQNLALFGEGSRDLGAHLVKQAGKVATLARILSFVVDVDDKGVVNAEQREAARVVFQRELSIGWLMQTHGLTEDKARAELADMTERAKKARANAQTNWARTITVAELRDPETDEQAAKREEAAAKKAATKAKAKAEKAKGDADKAQGAADAATSAVSQAIAPTAEKPASDAPQASQIGASPVDVLAALLRLDADAMLACVTKACEDMRRAGNHGKATDAALASIVLVGASWRKDRDAEIESAKANPALDAAQAEIAALKAQLAEQAKAAHGPAQAAPAATPKPRTARGK